MVTGRRLKTIAFINEQLECHLLPTMVLEECTVIEACVKPSLLRVGNAAFVLSSNGRAVAKGTCVDMTGA